MFLNIDTKTWMGLSVVGATISTIGSVFGVIIKDYFFSRSFELWKQRQTLEQIYQKYRDPLLLSANELSSRLQEVLEHFPTVYLKQSVLASRPEKQISNNLDDPYFQRHKLLSTAYRLCALLAWLELYRQEVTFLRLGSNKHAQLLELAVEMVRSDLADGQLNQAPDWSAWRDTLIFREELRAIGESLLETRGTTRTVIGYGRYIEQLESASENSIQRWTPVVLNFILELDGNGKDFRRTRMKRLFVHLVNLMCLVGNNKIAPYLKKNYDIHRKEIDL